MMKIFDIDSNSGIIPAGDSGISPVFTEISLLYSSPEGYSEIYKGKRFGKWHALKTLKSSCAPEGRYRNLLVKEFEISYLLTHPHIVQVIGWEEVELAPADIRQCIIMEYIDGIPLDKFLEENPAGAEDLLPALEELCDAISYIHKKGIIHRDIKPANILITLNGNHAKLIDFGLSDTSEFAILKEPAGSYPFASPEQRKARVPIDNRADIYGLGMVIRHIHSNTVCGLPNARKVIRKCTAKKREHRFATAAEVYKKLNDRKGYTAFAAVSAIFITALLSSFFAYNMGLMVKKSESHTVVDTLRLINRQSLEAASPILIYDSISKLVIRNARNNCLYMLSRIDTLPTVREKLITMYKLNRELLERTEEYPVQILDKCLPASSPEYNLYKTSLIKLAEDIYNRFYSRTYDSLRTVSIEENNRKREKEIK